MREYVEIEGTTFILQKIVPFNQWLADKGLQLADVLKSKKNERDDIYLLWKWGSVVSGAELEFTRKRLIQTIKDIDLSTQSQAYKFYFNTILEFEKVCYTIKQQLGLIELTEEEKQNPVLKKIIEKFEGHYA